MISEKKIGIVGFGVMGQSILKGILDSGLIQVHNFRATTIADEIAKCKSAFPGVEISSDNESVIDWADIIILW